MLTTSERHYVTDVNHVPCGPHVAYANRRSFMQHHLLGVDV